MWFAPKKYEVKLENVNERLLQLQGELNDKELRLTLAEFLRHNLGFTTELISGIKLAPYQQITLRAFFNRNFVLCCWTRGGSKSFVAAVYCFLKCIFEPGSKILIAGPTFRTSRNIFDEIDKIASSPGAKLLAQAMDKPIRRNDLFSWRINDGDIKAIPLNGEKIRGFRATDLILDEFLLLSKEMVDNVLKPFLVAPANMAERVKIATEEKRLVREGKMSVDDMTQFENSSRMICLSSASYTFENLYQLYSEWMGKIYNEHSKEDSNYFISQLGWEAIPEEMIDKTIIEEAQNGGSSTASFQREYGAQFTDGSESYFSAKKMYQCTVQDTQEPVVEISGEKNEIYVLAIDPSFSNSPNSDDFAMCLVKVDQETRTTVMVNGYAEAGKDLKDHIAYLFYLMNSFPIRLIIIDNAGSNFIDACNESELFMTNNLRLDFFDFDSDMQDDAYQSMLRGARQQYNLESKRMCFKQLFTSDFIRRSNEYLQTCIDYQKIQFASKLTAHPQAYERSTNKAIDVKLLPSESIYDFISYQDSMIVLTKKECSLVEITITAKGAQNFELPNNLRRSSAANRARKDSYTALLLANWGAKAYFDLNSVPKQQTSATFTPRIYR